MGKHKKHHKSERKELLLDERSEKPLKLVLKVGGTVQSPVHASNSNSSSSQVPRPPLPDPPDELRPPPEKPAGGHSHEKHKKSKKKKKKKSTDKDRHERKRKHHHHHHHHREYSHERKEKRRKEQESSRSVGDCHDSLSRDSLSLRAEPLAPTPTLEKRDARTCTLKRKMKTSLQTLLSYLIKKLQQKDPQDFFAWPVTDVIAPGYSSIIASPIDFSTIAKRNDDQEYKSVLDFKADVKLMCDNAMTYNRADTVYYKSARRLWHAAQKLTNREQLAGLKRTFSFVGDLSVEELGFSIRDVERDQEPTQGALAAEPLLPPQPEAKKSKVAPCWSSADLEEEEDEDPEEILAQAQKAARAAADRLTLRRPHSKFGFLRQNENGTTTLAIIHPKSGDREVRVNLEMLAGKVAQGTGSIPGFKEDSKNFVKPISYSAYGSYCSHAPHYDSSFSTLAKDDSDLLLSTYGDDTGAHYAHSLTTFARDSDYALGLVDSLLDSLTGGEHSRTAKLLEERRAMREEEMQGRRRALNEVDAPGDLEEEMESELSRLEATGGKGEVRRRKEILCKRRAFQMKLDSTTQMLVELKRVQGERLSSNPPLHLALVRPPSAAESDLADKVVKKIADVTSHVPPEDVVSVRGLRRAMGITPPRGGTEGPPPCP